ncbi:MAG: hypothetical protein FWE77_06160 [Clostridia bacterium]|nr:hypothetical protein [Clostridia bacterium]
MSDVDAYIMRFHPEIQQRLASIRQTALNVFGDMDEKMIEEKTRYTLPAFFANGKDILFYGAYKDHISICVGYDWVDFLKCQYPQFHYTKATIQFLHEDPFPDEVVQVICELLKQGLSGWGHRSAETQ